MPLQESLNKISARERKSELDALVGEIKGKMDKINGENQLTDLQADSIRQELLGKFFEILKTAGINPNDLESINKFLMNLQQQNPDLYELFEESFDNLSGSAEQPTDETGLMNWFGNLAQQTMMPREAPEGQHMMPDGTMMSNSAMPPTRQ